MPKTSNTFRRWVRPTWALALALLLARPAFAADDTVSAPAPAPSPAPSAPPQPQAGTVITDLPSQNTVISLIDRLAARGLLTKRDTAELLLLAEADAAESRAQAAMTQAALAQAAAAEARARAIAALAGMTAGSRTSVAALPP